MRRTTLFALGTLLSTVAPAAFAADEADYVEFFENFQRLSLEYDASIAQLYAPDATIMGARKRADGTEEEMTIDGARWRAIIMTSMERAEAVGDRSEYDTITYDVGADRATISAHRRSALECFTDERFYMIVAESEDDELLIVEQFMETPAASLCEQDASALPEFLQTTVEMINKQLPAEIDPETQLVRTSADGSTMTYHYVLLNHTSSTLSSDEATSRMSPLVVQQACGSPNLRPILDQDGTVAFVYRGSDGTEIVRLDVDKSAC